MSYHEINFPSANGRDTIQAYYYTPLDAPKGIIQVIHGFGEHCRRYAYVIDKFVEAGYVVFGDDHLGHGATGLNNGHMGDPHSGGFKTFVKDERTLHEEARKLYPDIPYFVFGHSWGSMISRTMAALAPEDITAITLCGNVSQVPGCIKLAKDEAFAKAYEEDPYGDATEWTGAIFAGMTDRFDPDEGPNGWIAGDTRIVTDHANDMFNTFEVTVEMDYDFVKMYEFIEDPSWAPSVPTDIPFYLVSGDQDPCGNYGEGVYNIANRLVESGHSVETRLWPGYRHEIHNERPIRDEVCESVIAFFDRFAN